MSWSDGSVKIRLQSNDNLLNRIASSTFEFDMNEDVVDAELALA